MKMRIAILAACACTLALTATLAPAAKKVAKGDGGATILTGATIETPDQVRAKTKTGKGGAVFRERMGGGGGVRSGGGAPARAINLNSSRSNKY